MSGHKKRMDATTGYVLIAYYPVYKESLEPNDPEFQKLNDALDKI